MHFSYLGIYENTRSLMWFIANFETRTFIDAIETVIYNGDLETFRFDK